MTSARYTQDKIAKMYACSIATKNSNPTSTITKLKGMNLNNNDISTIALPITCSSMCPEVMFAARRKDKLIGLAKKEKSSITVIRGASQIGHPLGRNSLKNPMPWENIPNKVITRNTTAERAKVMIIWLVVAKLLGNIPQKFEDRTNKKIVNIKGTNFLPFSSPMVLSSMLTTILCTTSTDTCSFDGTN
jgi:hypothetical protein